MHRDRASTGAEAIATYIRAKDGSRPHLMRAAFADDAELEIVVKTGAISFPPFTKGEDAITEVLVRQFSRTFENVYTLCLSAPPTSDRNDFSCAWLVGMTERETSSVRVGVGRYDWSFRSGLVGRLKISIELMQVLPPEALPSVMEWLSKLPYPWCPIELAARTMPEAKDLRPVADHLRKVAKPNDR
jgi:hypothetical protein